MAKFIFFTVVFFNSRVALSPGYINFWVIWNVGQGQWITHVTNTECRHFDFGGEIQYFKFIQKQFVNFCNQKTNRLYLSHGDLDHYNFITLINNRVNSVCWMVKPNDFNPPNLKIPLCLAPKLKINRIGPLTEFNSNQTVLNDCNPRYKNSCSTIFKREKFLFAGDSPKSKERLWSPTLEQKSEIKVLVLGHHGSRTSTSQSLIDRLPQLKMTVASARFAKYGHPHKETRSLLKKNKIPNLRTEFWGHLIFE